MAKTKKTRRKTEFGDFQTPVPLARLCCERIAETIPAPVSIIEPTCGLGHFIEAAIEAFPTIRSSVGIEINREHVAVARERLHSQIAHVEIHHADLFSFDRQLLVESSPSPLLVIGNPPWVTNSELGRLGSQNLPPKSNLQAERGFDALTGKSNFDISEWMLIEFMRLLAGRNAVSALLCKTSVARRALTYSWRGGIAAGRCALYKLDAARWFGAAVDACLCVCDYRTPSDAVCDVYESLEENHPSSRFGLCDDQLVGDVDRYRIVRHLRSRAGLRWRSGIKHDCSRVMELSVDGDCYKNGMGETVDIEPAYVYPLLKSSDLAAGNVARPRRQVIVPQRRIGEQTAAMEIHAPLTWGYLQRHRDKLDRRASSIYRNQPLFSIFGVGEYSFAPWKVAISGFYKTLEFRVVGNMDGRPIMLDDTAYFFPCQTEQQAQLLCRILNSELARNFLESLVFWDAKRPITVQKLSQIDPIAIADALGWSDELASPEWLAGEYASSEPRDKQMSLFSRSGSL